MSMSTDYDTGYGFVIISKFYMVGVRVKAGYGKGGPAKMLFATVWVVIDEKLFTRNGLRKPF